VLNRHLAFHDADWALKGPDLARLELILGRLAPEGLVERTAWLFNEHYPDVPQQPGKSHIDAVDVMRREAAQQLLQAEGTQGLVRLAAAVDFPQFVATAAIEVLTTDRCAELVDAALGASERLNLFALAVSGEARRRDGPSWSERLSRLLEERSWTGDQKATLFLGWPDEPSTWQIVSSLGPEVDRSYWRRKMPWGLRGTVEDLMIATRKYLTAGRATAALDALHGRVNEFPHSLLFELIDAVIQELASKRSEPNNMVIHHLEEILEKLAARQDVPLIELARREYALLPALGYRERTLSVHRYMAETPEFFVEILAHVFRAKSEETGETREATQEEIARAEVGYRLLNSFRVVPGTSGSEVNGSALRSWINVVRAEASRIDRSEIADEYVGHVLAHSPMDSIDAGWPHRATREVIERLNSDRVERGIQVERFNMRGVVSKAMFEGGRQERALAAECREWTKKALAYPRTAALLRNLAEVWDREATAEDERARKDQMRFG
jgi:hypothetical protein